MAVTQAQDGRYGRESGKQHLEEYLSVKAVWIKTGQGCFGDPGHMVRDARRRRAPHHE